MRNKKKGAALMLTICMTAALAMNVWAAESRTKITSIRLKISSSIEAGSSDDDIEITTTSSLFTVGEVEIQNDVDEWEAGDIPKAKVWLYADDDYYFSSTSSSVFTLTGDDATYVSAKTEDSKATMVLTFKLDALEGDLYVDDAEWEDDTSGVGSWSDTDGAKSYQVRLYRGSSSVTSIIDVSGTTYNFSSYITKTGDYTYKVRAVSSSSGKGEWTESDNWYVDSDTLAIVGTGVGSSVTSGGTWQQDGVGWWFRNSDGSWPTNAWMKINNLWYFFNSNGYMATGWVQTSGIWYYCDQTTGAMLVSGKTPDGYTVDANGAWLGY